MTDVFIGILAGDLTPPVVTNQDPAPGSTAGPTTGTFSFDVVDVGAAGVDLTTVQVFMSGVLARDGAGFKPGFSGSVTPISGGYHVVVTRTAGLPLCLWVHVQVLASDLNGNVMAPATWVYRIRSPSRAAECRHPGTSGTVTTSGYFGGTSRFGPGEPNETTISAGGPRDGFLARQALSTGDLLWVRRIGGSGDDSLEDVSVFA